MSAAPETMDELLSEPGEAVEQATDAVDERLQAVADAVTETTREQPFLAVAAAFGVGAVLGGGVPNWALNLAAKSASRAAMAYALARVAPTGE